MELTLDKKLDAVIRHLVKTDVGDMVSHEIKIRFEGVLSQMTTLQTSIDAMTQQLQEDRQDLNNIKIDMAKSLTQNKVIIENQNTQETKVVEAVENATDAIPHKVSESVDKIFQKKGFIQKMIARLTK